MKLSDLKKNQSAVVTKITAEQTLKDRLLSFGILRGTKITVAECAPAKKTIKIIANNTMLALRAEEAKCIEVKI